MEVEQEQQQLPPEAAANHANHAEEAAITNAKPGERITLPQMLWEQREKGEFTDMSIVGSGGCVVYAHRALVAFSHSSIAAAFMDRLGQEEDIVVIAPDFDEASIKHDLLKVYFGKEELEFQLLNVVGDHRTATTTTTTIQLPAHPQPMMSHHSIVPQLPPQLPPHPVTTPQIGPAILPSSPPPPPPQNQALPLAVKSVINDMMKKDIASVVQPPQAPQLPPQLPQQPIVRPPPPPQQVNNSLEPLNYYCTLCPAVSDSLSQYEKHLLQHVRTDTATGQKYCPFCNKEMTARRRENRNMVAHLVIHIDSSYYKHKCTYCEKRFYTSSKQKEHENAVHTGKLAFICQLCNQGFCTSARRAVHKKRDCPFAVKPVKKPKGKSKKKKKPVPPPPQIIVKQEDGLPTPLSSSSATINPQVAPQPQQHISVPSASVNPQQYAVIEMAQPNLPYGTYAVTATYM